MKSNFVILFSISNSVIKSTLKLIYYQLILYVYKFVGYAAKSHKIQANSSWTYGHMVDLWGTNKGIKKLFPPCSIDNLL